MVTYRNTVTGRFAERDEPDRLMEGSKRWQRVEPRRSADAEFDPSDHTAREVNDYLADVEDSERARVLAAEADGKARSTVLTGPHAERS